LYCAACVSKITLDFPDSRLMKCCESYCNEEFVSLIKRQDNNEDDDEFDDRLNCKAGDKIIGKDGTERVLNDITVHRQAKSLIKYCPKTLLQFQNIMDEKFTQNNY